MKLDLFQVLYGKVQNAFLLENLQIDLQAPNFDKLVLRRIQDLP
ncbi:hypothetical protein J558_1948 [Acinetobacter baumannii 1106579]|nr:hypothetical protein J558_1948 [Acinetobacter baumannii 1106579]